VLTAGAKPFFISVFAGLYQIGFIEKFCDRQIKLYTLRFIVVAGFCIYFSLVHMVNF
jgi:hypothetical protein